MLVLTCSLGTLTARAQIEPVDSLIVVDSTGRKVGRAVDSENAPKVALNIEGHLILFIVRSDELVLANPSPLHGNRILYESEDCTGQMFIALRDRVANDPLEGITIDAAIGPPNQTVYVPNLDDVPRTLRPNSTYGGPGDCARASGETRAVLPIPLAGLDEFFTPQFQIVPAPPSCCGDCNGDRAVSVDELVSGVGNALRGCP